MRRCRTRQPTFLIRCARFSVTTGAALIASATAIGQTKKDPLDSPDGFACTMSPPSQWTI